MPEEAKPEEAKPKKAKAKKTKKIHEYEVREVPTELWHLRPGQKVQMKECRGLISKVERGLPVAMDVHNDDGTKTMGVEFLLEDYVSLK